MLMLNASSLRERLTHECCVNEGVRQKYAGKVLWVVSLLSIPATYMWRRRSNVMWVEKLGINYSLVFVQHQWSRTPRREKSALFSCVSVNSFGKTGRVLYFCTNLCMYHVSPRSPLRAEYFGTRIGPVRWSHHVAMRNANACILHACDVCVIYDS